jgi:hypothetical protein
MLAATSTMKLSNKFADIKIPYFFRFFTQKMVDFLFSLKEMKFLTASQPHLVVGAPS